ncbi:MAG: glutamate 5-kinase [Myxococcaceae bacterium]
MKIVVKVGTQAILAPDGSILESVMKNLVQQLAELKKAGHQVLLVTSGAVPSGRRIAREILEQEFGSTTGEKQLLASLGQHVLLNAYANWFKPFGIATSQILLTKQDFKTKQHYLNIARLTKRLLNTPNIIPIINENDSVAIEELMFTDNDELAGLIAMQQDAHKLIILSSVGGVFDGPPESPSSKLISILNARNWPSVSSSKTALGRGGMFSKLNTAKKASAFGITVHIANLDTPNILSRLIQGEPIGTTILPTC